MSISQNIFEAIDTIALKTLQQTKFDQTIIGKVVAQHQTEKNQWLIDIGTAKFYAFGQTKEDENVEYNIGSQVQVLIPNGDYGEVKRIIGVITSSNKNDTDKVSTNKFENFVLAKSHICSSLKSNIEFKYNAPYDRIGLKIKFKTLSSKNNIDLSSYGVIVNFLDSDGKIIFSSNFTNKDILGNPKELNENITYYKLSSLINRIDFRQITKIDVKTYLGENSNADIFSQLISSLELSFGYDIDTIKSNPIQIFTEKKVLYSEENLGYKDISFTDNIYLEWYYNNVLYTTYLNNYDVNSFKVFRYARGINENENDPFSKAAGPYWKDVTPTDTNYYKFKKPSLEASDERIKFVVKTEGEEQKEEYKVSSIQIYKNLNAKLQAILSTGEDLLLTLSDSGIYNYYGMDGHLFTGYSQERTVIAKFKNGDELNADNGVESITWTYPTKSTIIQPVYKDDKKEELKGHNTDTFYYRLNSIAYTSYTNNTITCEVKMVSGNKFYGSITLEFGGGRMQGTPYSLNLDWCVKTHKYIVTQDNNGLLRDIIATFERIDGEPLDIVPSFEWTWYEPLWKNSKGESIISYLTPFEAQTKEGNKYTAKATVSFNQNIGANLAYYNAVAQVSVTYTLDNGTQVTLKDYLPIPLFTGNKESDKLISFYGPDRVVYDMEGKITYDLTPFCLKGATGNEYNKYFSIYTTTQVTANTYQNKLQWSNYQKYDSTDNDIHQLRTNTKNNQIVSVILDPANNMSIPDKPRVCTLICKNNDHSSTLYISPIVTLHNAWNYQNINQWTGKEIYSDDDKQYLLAPMIGAGKKGEGNTFSGVMMGKVNTSTGLYGYKDGIPRFYFNDKGYAYIGNGTNFLSFDNNGFNIETVKFKVSAQDGKFIIDSTNNKLILGDKFSFDGTNLNITGNGTFTGTITANSGKIGYLTLSPYGKMFKITEWPTDTGSWVAYCSGINTEYATANNSNVFLWAGVKRIGDNKSPWQERFSEQNWYYPDLYITQGVVDGTTVINKANFYVTHTGNLYAKNAEIEGKITATTGNIANWIIGTNNLHYGSVGTDNSIYLVAGGTNQTYTIAGKTQNGWCITVNNKFGVDKTGAMYATGANITGNITCTTLTANNGGTVAGWIIDSHKIYKKSVWSNSTLTKSGTGMCSDGQDPAFYAGFGGNGGDPWSHTIMENNGTHSDGPWTIYTKFYVTNGGKLYAREADISGIITCDKLTAETSGSIGGWTIGSSGLSRRNGALQLNNNGFTFSDGEAFFTAGQSTNHPAASKFSTNGLYIYKNLNVNKTAGDVRAEITTFGDNSIIITPYSNYNTLTRGGLYLGLSNQYDTSGLFVSANASTNWKRGFCGTINGLTFIHGICVNTA